MPDKPPVDQRILLERDLKNEKKGAMKELDIKHEITQAEIDLINDFGDAAAADIMRYWKEKVKIKDENIINELVQRLRALKAVLINEKSLTKPLVFTDDRISISTQVNFLNKGTTIIELYIKLDDMKVYYREKDAKGKEFEREISVNELPELS